ncbi:30S ribosome-binding factor RbfA [Desulfococcaceae bacterium HSG7]|nr:30S ribosome-binding factor RbfA [Desulfococcaceae bacterium HSG9]MDM8554972.1 30S ribosome-binding factor RbfA [Desulfococcaceae bacterium HSG7]
MKPFARSERVGGQIQKMLSELLHKSIHDPRLEMTTITGVRMTRDLKIAKIYFTSPGGASNVKRVSDGFKSSRGYIKRMLASRLGLRYMPDLQFYYDESFDYGAKIDKLLQSVKTESHIPADTRLQDERTNNTTTETE